MPRINTIQDGQPLTYELINQIIAEVNKIKETPENSSQQIEVYGPGTSINSDTSVAKIIAGSEQFTLSAGQSGTNQTIKFRSGGFTVDNPIVVATLVDTDEARGVQMGNITVTSVTKNSFDIKVKLIKARDKNVRFLVNYMAVGADSA